MNRRVARETVLKALYAEEIGHHSPSEVMQTIIKADLSSDPETFRFAEELFLRTRDNKASAEERIAQHSSNWDLKRVAVIDRILLRMAVSEFVDFEDIPTKVTINEAIDLAKIYSTRDSGRFVNGLLDAILQDLKTSGTLNKKGRGLVDTSPTAKKTAAGRVAGRTDKTKYRREESGERRLDTPSQEKDQSTLDPSIASALEGSESIKKKPVLRARKRRAPDTQSENISEKENPL